MSGGRRVIVSWGLAVWGVALGAGPLPALAAPVGPRSAFVVNSPADDADAAVGNGLCETAATGECTLRAALQEANALAGADTVTFSVTGTIALAAALPALTETLTLAGPGSDQLTIAGNGVHPVLQFIRNDVHTVFTVAGLTVRDGNGLAGGGLHQEGLSSLVISATTITANEAYNYGGGLYHEGPATLIDSVVQGNRAGQAGGGLFSSGPLSVIRSVIFENQVQAFSRQSPGGALLPLSGAGGGAGLPSGGGGLALAAPAHATLAASAIYSNSAPSGGGLSSSGVLTLTDVTVSGNRAAEDGGGLYLGAAGVTALRHVTLADNVADSDHNATGDGGGLFTLASATRLTNTLVALNVDWGGEAPDCAGAPLSGGYNLLQSTTGCAFTPTVGDLVDVIGPLLLPLAADGGTMLHALPPDSPARDAAGAAGCTPTDQRGVPRPIGLACDIGAFELYFRLLLPLVLR